MDVRNCKNCGRMFNYMGGAPLCSICQKKLENKFQDVKKFLDEHPNATVAEVSEEMDVSTKQIKQWIREERLTISCAGADGIVCEKCGAPICSGRFCNKCKSKMVTRLNDALDKPKDVEVKKEHDGNRMRFLQ